MKYRVPVEWSRFSPDDFKSYSMPRTNGRIDRCVQRLRERGLDEAGAYELLLKLGSFMNERMKK